ncbi:MAG: chromate efflux transporter [Pseudomonadota bacterium]
MTDSSPARPTTSQMLAIFWRIGILSFGGPAAQISVMHRELVDERGWLTEKQFLNALSFCMLLPGPEAMQLATYAGWKLNGWRGGLIGGLLFVLPGAAVIFALAALYVAFGNVPLVYAIFFGVQCAVLVIVLQALRKVAGRALNGWPAWAIALAAFIGLYFLAVPYPLIVFAAALVGFFFLASSEALERVERPKLAAISGTFLLWGALWLVPLAVLYAMAPDGILARIGLFFSQLAVVTFGGAYAVLAYIAQDVVTNFGWLTQGQLIDALGLAETTPGPLILVTQFVGFLAAAGSPELGGLAWGFAGGAVALWVTFVPCFLWIFAGAPYIEWIAAQPRLKSALDAITAAVVGVIAYLSVWFAIHVLFGHLVRVEQGFFEFDWSLLSTARPAAFVLFIIAAIMAFALKWGMGRVLLVSAVLGVLVVRFLTI